LRDPHPLSLHDALPICTENGTEGNKSTVERIRDLGDAFVALDDAIQSPEILALIGTVTGIPDLLYDPYYFGGGTHENRQGQDLRSEEHTSELQSRENLV